MSHLIYKTRVEPPQLVVLKALKSRITLSNEDKQNYYNLHMGYQGEQKFDALLKDIQRDCLILNDLLLSFNHQIFQIDSLLIMQNQIHLFEIKNYVGDFYYESNRFFQKNRSEISNPLNQLERTESLLRQLLFKHNFSIPIQSSVIFINPGFTLYQAPSEKPFIFPTQLDRFVNKLNVEHFKLNEQHRKIAEILKTLSIQEHPLLQYPSYSFNALQKGIKCLSCESFSLKPTTNRCLEVICLSCGKKEQFESALIRTIKEFQVLFPTEKVTTQRMVEWFNHTISPKTIRRILKKNFRTIGTNRWIYFE